MSQINSAILPVICLAGPTGAGKTDLALQLAAKLDAEIVNADSRQVYDAFPLICACPSPSERAQCQHYLYNFLSVEQKISAGQWVALAVDKIRSILQQGKVPLLVGGTGLYFQALLHGLATIPQVDPSVSRSLEKRLTTEGSEALYAELQHNDPVYATRIHPHDSQRIVRALEVWQTTGRSFSWWHLHAMSKPYAHGSLFVLDITLQQLEPRLAQRIDKMLQAGAIEEARQALLLYPQQDAPGWSGIGCKELRAYLEGQCTLEQCREAWLANTRAYAKRQITWFRHRPDSVFISAGNPEKLYQLAIEQWRAL